MGKIRKLQEKELVDGVSSEDLYPVTSVKAIYDENNERLDHILSRRGAVNISTNYNNDHIAEVLTLSQAINKVPSNDRVLGFNGTFLSENGWENVYFIGDSLVQWQNSNNWLSVPNNLYNSLLKNATFAGIATPETNPGTPDGPVFYIATEPGVYVNFGNLTITDRSIISNNNSSWEIYSFRINKDLSYISNNGFKKGLNLIEGAQIVDGYFADTIPTYFVQSDSYKTFIAKVTPGLELKITTFIHPVNSSIIFRDVYNEATRILEIPVEEETPIDCKVGEGEYYISIPVFYNSLDVLRCIVKNDCTANYPLLSKPYNNVINLNDITHRNTPYENMTQVYESIPDECKKAGNIVLYNINGKWSRFQILKDNFTDRTDTEAFPGIQRVYLTVDTVHVEKKESTFEVKAHSYFPGDWICYYSVIDGIRTGSMRLDYNKELATSDTVFLLSKSQYLVLNLNTTCIEVVNKITSRNQLVLLATTDDLYLDYFGEWYPLIIGRDTTPFEIKLQDEDSLYIPLITRIMDEDINRSRSSINFRFNGTLMITSNKTGVTKYFTMKDIQDFLDAQYGSPGSSLSEFGSYISVAGGRRLSYNLYTDSLMLYVPSYDNLQEGEVILVDTFQSDPSSKNYYNIGRGFIIDTYYKVLAHKHEVEVNLKFPELYLLKEITTRSFEFLSKITADDLIFTLTTDAHSDTYNLYYNGTDKAYPIINYLHDRGLGAHFHVDLGDVIIQRAYMYTDRRAAVNNAVHALGSFKCPIYYTVGNHDYNSHAGDNPEGIQRKEHFFSDDDVFNFYGRWIAKDLGIVWGSKKKLYYYKDLDSYKIRMIFLNTTDNVVEFNSEGIMTTPDPMIASCMRQDQMDWFANVALDFTSKGEDKTNWHTIVFSHHCPAPGFDACGNTINGNGKGEGGKDPEWIKNNNLYHLLVKGFKEGSSVEYHHIDDVLNGTATINLKKDFSTQGPMNLIGVFCGHEHRQLVLDFDGIIYRTFNSAYKYDVYPEATLNTASAYMIAINTKKRKVKVMHIGAGEDWDITY